MDRNTKSRLKRRNVEPAKIRLIRRSQKAKDIGKANDLLTFHTPGINPAYSGILKAQSIDIWNEVTSVVALRNKRSKS